MTDFVHIFHFSDNSFIQFLIFVYFVFDSVSRNDHISNLNSASEITSDFSVYLTFYSPT